jgi:hypothetical protein
LVVFHTAVHRPPGLAAAAAFKESRAKINRQTQSLSGAEKRLWLIISIGGPSNQSQSIKGM